MLSSIELIALLVIAVNFIVTYVGMKDAAFYERYALDVERVKEEREFYRIVSSGFLHNSWFHLLYNSIFLLGMTHIAGNGLSARNFILVYLMSLLVASLYVAYYNKKATELMSASTAAISGTICAIVLLTPGAISFSDLPYSIPVWAAGVVYLVFASISLSGKGIGANHELVLTGALTGAVISLFAEPVIIKNNILVFVLAGLLLSFVFIMTRKKPALFTFRWGKKQEEPDLFENGLGDEDELNRLLEKVNRRGMESLSRKEKRKLEELSRKI